MIEALDGNMSPTAEQRGVKTTSTDSFDPGSFVIKDPRQLELLVDQVMGQNGLKLGTKIHEKTAYYNCFSGEELAEWIRSKKIFDEDEVCKWTMILLCHS